MRISVEGPAWLQRAVERSTKAACLRAERTGIQFIEAAHAVVAEKASIEFTVQDLVDRSDQSMRSFYRYFGSKDELLCALFDNVLWETAGRIQKAALERSGPLDRLGTAVRMLFEICGPDPVIRYMVLADLATSHSPVFSAEMRTARQPLLTMFTELVTEAREAGKVAAGVDARRTATMVVQTVMILAVQTHVGTKEGQFAGVLTADEVWDFCSSGFGSF
ncbi:transcriptional regulator, TetR family [Parafrankia sp. EAN1pec]|uniref:TetR/AcrR family transcriptional regulator n=1 Tax=Parafrankia sp. (strain EAN1pec) TaxID=298653 RepID=UPI00015D9E71|nr:transcriptional regulator, TetR family [Frankia sp. EAN1pec]